MATRPRFVAALSLADGVTATNAALGFLAAALAPFSPPLAARFVLLAAVADGLDGVLATHVGSTPVGEFLDSLADVASFCVAPALLVVSTVRLERGTMLPEEAGWLALAIAALFVVSGVVRLGLYTAYDVERGWTEGVQTTLAATVLAAGLLAGIATPVVLVGATAVFAGLMVAPIGYPDLRVRDALVMGIVQAGAIVAPSVLFRVFPRVLLACALAYLVLGPRFYPTGGEGKRT
ncbi:protein sorting system archaetidylserine synthase [Halococcus thailandensis]|uniref:CDP-diacylglycerol--serine O-phosphatidyltransferase n=1 Tax=Halococcus thailandensis JCM 13552 TaxID=1227457 RepID=M0N4U9_9EURY|nr:protein sorting system archaetidylserine synthase [Halococcus thailandensis]EMA52139.1 CDP-diacylglycerol--serine O-phosphatidyltransferase [Halococcus thailandensis JCM 13552]